MKREVEEDWGALVGGPQVLQGTLTQAPWIALSGLYACSAVVLKLRNRVGTGPPAPALGSSGETASMSPHLPVSRMASFAACSYDRRHN